MTSGDGMKKIRIETNNKLAAIAVTTKTSAVNVRAGLYVPVCVSLFGAASIRIKCAENTLNKYKKK